MLGEPARAGCGAPGHGRPAKEAIASTLREGRVIAKAFADAYNHMVQSRREYHAQETEGGLGRGGGLKAGQ